MLPEAAYHTVFKKEVRGIWKVPQLTECLLHKFEDLSLISKNYIKMLGTVVLYTCNSCTEEVEMEALWPVSLAYLLRSSLMRVPG